MRNLDRVWVDIYLSFILIIFISLASTGCTQHKRPEAPVFASDDQDDVNESPQVDWYIDGTASMKGFVRQHEDTPYVYFLRSIQSSLSSNAKVTYRRFGERSQKFSRLSEASDPEFYSSSDEIFRNTDLTVAAENAGKSDHLTIIVSDLYPDRSDFEPLLKRLSTEGLGQSFVAGILGCRAEFRGIIYDIPPTRSNMPFPSHGGDARRPVYALILGSDFQVRSLLLKARRESNHIGAEIVSVLISPKVGNFNADDFSNSENSALHASDFDETDGLKQGGKSKFSRQLRLSRSARNPKLEFTAKVSFEPFEAVPADGWKMEREVHMCNYTDSSFSAFKSHSKNQDPEVLAKDQCPVTTADYEILYQANDTSNSIINRELTVPITLDFGKRGDSHRDVRARPGCIYVINLKLESKDTNVIMPKWVSEFSQSRSNNFDGLKTTDLDPFLRALAARTLNNRPATAMDVDLYIDSK